MKNIAHATISVALLIARQRPDGTPQPLIDHLQGVATRAATVGQKINAAHWAKLAGLWHDLGKYRPGFQTYIHQFADAHCETAVTGRDNILQQCHTKAALPKANRCMMYLIGIPSLEME